MSKTRAMNIMMLGLRGFPNVEGGVESHAEKLCLQLTNLGCHVSVIVRSPYQDSSIGTVWRGINFISIWAPKSMKFEAITHSFFGLIYAAIKRPDILHIHAIGPSIITFPARLLGLRVIVTHHGPDYDRQKWGRLAKSVLKLGERWGMRWSNERIAISGVISELIKKKHNMGSRLIHNGIDLPDIPESQNMLDRFGLKQGKYVLLVSRFVPEKRHHDLIQAFSDSKLKDWKLVLVGGTNHADAYTQSVISAASMVRNVICTGFQTGETLKGLYANAGIFVLPSSHEGLSIALLEALSYGLPVLASNIPANLELNLPEDCYFELGNVNQMTEKIKSHSKSVLTKERKSELRNWVSENYNWEKVGIKTYQVYQDCLES